jgi:hypothetical protein
MRFVYQQALSVCVWLGPASEYSYSIMDELANVGGKAINGGFLEMKLDQPWDNELNAPIVSALCQTLSNISHPVRVSQLLKFLNAFGGDVCGCSRKSQSQRKYTLHVDTR